MPRDTTIFSEMAEYEDVLASAGGLAEVRHEATVTCRQESAAIMSLRLGSTDPEAPVIAFFGGVHGLERIGSGILVSYLRGLMNSLAWDASLRSLLTRVRVLFYPIVNPFGVLNDTRCNGNGVDIMRNAPIDAEEPTTLWLVGGHRVSSWLPWYRGALGKPMEAETAALCAFVRREVLPAPFALTLDVHSGFGTRDRLWFPYAGTCRPFENLSEMFAVYDTLNTVLPHHVYRVEPQSVNYITHGDVWDYLYKEHRGTGSTNVFLPLTLELGSWLWVRKNPWQALTRLGVFHPIQPHRVARVMRRHLPLLDFLIRATSSYRQLLSPYMSNAFTGQRAQETWFPA